jgi:hypothetical protein
VRRDEYSELPQIAASNRIGGYSLSALLPHGYCLTRPGTAELYWRTRAIAIVGQSTWGRFDPGATRVVTTTRPVRSGDGDTSERNLDAVDKNHSSPAEVSRDIGLAPYIDWRGAPSGRRLVSLIATRGEVNHGPRLFARASPTSVVRRAQPHAWRTGRRRDQGASSIRNPSSGLFRSEARSFGRSRREFAQLRDRKTIAANSLRIYRPIRTNFALCWAKGLAKAGRIRSNSSRAAEPRLLASRAHDCLTAICGNGSILAVPRPHARPEILATLLRRSVCDH